MAQIIVLLQLAVTLLVSAHNAAPAQKQAAITFATQAVTQAQQFLAAPQQTTITPAAPLADPQEFALRSKCAELGQAEQQKEQSDAAKATPPLVVMYSPAEYGYSRKLNTCYYSGADVLGFGNNPEQVAQNTTFSYYVMDLLTNTNLLSAHYQYSDSDDVKNKVRADFAVKQFLLLGQ